MPLLGSLFFPLERILRRGVGGEDVGFHARGAAVGALHLVLLGVYRLQAHLVLREHPVAHAAYQPGLAHAALLSLAQARNIYPSAPPGHG